MKHTVIIEENSTGVLTAYLKEYPSVVVQANTVEEVKDKLKKTFKQYLAYLNNSLESEDPFTAIPWYIDNPHHQPTKETDKPTKYLSDARVRVQYELPRSMEQELNLVFDNEHVKVATEMIQKLVDTLIKKRMKEVVIEEDFLRRAKTFKLDLYVFNKEELQELIQAIKLGKTYDI